MVRGKYSRFYEDTRQWRDLGPNGFPEVEREWRSEYTSMMDCPDFCRFKREPTGDPPPDRGGWSVRGNPTSFRSKRHHKDPRTEHQDAAKIKVWRKRVAQDPNVLSRAPVEICEDREALVNAAIAALWRSEQALSEAAHQLSENRDVVLDLAFEDLQALNEATKRLRGDRRHLLEDVHEDFSDLRLRAKELEAERKELLEELQREISVLEVNTYDARASMEDALVELAAQRNELEASKEELMEDIQLEAVRRHWDNLEDFHRVLMDDREMVVEAVTRYWPGVNFVAQHVRNDRNVLIEAAQPYFKACVDEDDPNSEAFLECQAIVDAVTEDSTNLEAMAKKMRRNRNTMARAIKEDWHNLQRATDTLRADRALVVAVASNTMVSGKW